MTIDTKAVARWAVQEVPEGIEHIRCAKYPDLLDYHHVVSGKGPHAYTWSDKPHRLVYDLTAEVAELRDEITDHERVVGELHAQYRKTLDARNTALAASRAEVEGYRRTLEIIAVGDSHNAMSDATGALVGAGFWTDKEKGNAS